MKGKNFVELERESQYVNAELEKIMQSIGGNNQVRWTLDVIRKMRENRIGQSDRLNMINRALEENRPVDKVEVDYLKQNYRILQKVLDEKKKIQWTLDLIKKLQENEIGNFDRMNIIKKTLEEGKPVGKHEIEYLQEKYSMLQKIPSTHN
jgi:hypothetical protein